MTKITEDQLKLCRIQGDVFAESASRVPCSSPIFMRRFMYSQVAQRMDSGSFLFEACETDQILEEINREFGDTTYGKERYSVEELYWIGYLYRYWCCTYDRSSKQVYKLVKPKELRALYYPYHSLDPAQAIERILESKGIIGVDSIARGVAVMRAAIQKERKFHLQEYQRRLEALGDVPQASDIAPYDHSFDYKSALEFSIKSGLKISDLLDEDLKRFNRY